MSRSGAILEVRDLVVRYGEVGGEGDGAVGAVDGACLDVKPECITALVGASGCGKTTLLRTVAGFERPQQGSVRLAGKLLVGEGRWVPPEKRQIGMVFQEGALFPHLSVLENVSYGLRRDPAARDKVARVLELVGLPDVGHRYPDELSGGQRQRVALARALAPEPRLVLMDEPFASLDAGLRERVRSQVRGILRAAGATAVLVTHDQEEALSVADQVAVMGNGRILQTGTPEEIYQRPTSLAVAEFIGDGHLVPCEVRDGSLRCSFGTATTSATDGPGYLYLRPEDLGIHPCPDPDSVHGRIVERRFFGHDVLDKVRLASGEEVEVRVLSSVKLPEGTAVTLSLRQRDFAVFERDRANR